MDPEVHSIPHAIAGQCGRAGQFAAIQNCNDPGLRCLTGGDPVAADPQKSTVCNRALDGTAAVAERGQVGGAREIAAGLQVEQNVVCHAQSIRYFGAPPVDALTIGGLQGQKHGCGGDDPRTSCAANGGVASSAAGLCVR